MAIIARSQEAEAAQRFVEASRNVDLAFRAVRGDAEDEESSVTHGVALFRLERALDELARAEALFDSAIRVQGLGRLPGDLEN